MRAPWRRDGTSKIRIKYVPQARKNIPKGSCVLLHTPEVQKQVFS